MMHELAHELCAGAGCSTGGGGYALVQVVPRTWTHLLAIAAGAPARPGNGDAGRVAGTGPLPDRRNRAAATMTDGAARELCAIRVLAWIPAIRLIARSCEPGLRCFPPMGYPDVIFFSPATTRSSVTDEILERLE